MKKSERTWRVLIAAVLSVVMLFACTACGSKAPNEPVPDTVPVPETEADTKTAGNGKRVYFAGPMFSQGEKDFNLVLVNVLEEYGYTVFLPQRDGLEAAKLEGKTDEEKVKIIFEKDVSEIQKADIVFMLVDGRVPDEGACVELGLAYAYGKRCYGAKTDTRSLELDLDLNPLISGCFIKMFKDFDGGALVRALKQYLSENEL